METLKFKTSIKCSGCIAAVTPALNEKLGENNWNIELQTPEKVLTVATEQPVKAEEIVTVMQNAGYKAEKIS
jgi:copper chaperone CopZ